MPRRPLDTSEAIVIFPKAIRWGMILGVLAIGCIGALVVPLAWQDEAWSMVWLGSGWLLFCFGLAGLLYRKRRKGHPEPALKLAPDGLHLLSGTRGVIPWHQVVSLGGFSVRGTEALVINVEQAAIDALDQSKFFETSRKLDAALNIHGLTFFQQQLELPIPEVVQLLHQYSIAHGGRPLVPDP